MGKFDIFNKFSSAVIIVNDKQEVVFKNNFFKRVFTDFDTLKKFSHKLDYNVSALVGDDVSVHSPMLQAIEAPQDFASYVSYQASSGEKFYYNMNASKKGRYKIIVLDDVTAEDRLEIVSRQNSSLQKQIKLLSEENKNQSKIKQQAQSQAMKLLLLNNISNIIRSSVDTSKILISALEELSDLFAAFQAYYAVYSKDMSAYIINKSLKPKFVGLKITFDKETEEKISKTKAFSSSCMR